MVKARRLRVDGQLYEVVETLGYVCGYYAKRVQTPRGERTAVKDGHTWRFWEPRDRLIPGPLL